ncbi:MAG TPA: glycosyltransferase [Solirubrobacterales bacterium]|nr:glycosyltransferase [Solirubrobacterales bacterium]
MPIGKPQTPDPERARHVVFSFDDLTWAAAQARGMCFPQDQLALALLDDAAVERLLICDRPRSAPIKLAKDLYQRPLRLKSSLRVGHWEPLRWRRREPVSIAALERSYRAYDRRLRKVAERRGLERPAIVTGQPFIAAFAPLEWAGPVTLFSTDDLAAHPDYRRWRPSLLAAYERIARSGRRLCAVSSAIVERIEPSGPAAIVPNGVDEKLWMSPQEAPAWFRRLPGPRLLYVGTIDSRLDVEALGEAARAFPDASVSLVGPLTEPAHVEPLLAEPNVSVHGSVSREEVAALCHGADACLLPHRETELTRAMSPLKLYEYLASGTPTVATDLEPVRRAGGSIVRVAPGGDFAAGVRAALEAGRVAEGARRAFVAENSWASRSAEVLDLALPL